MQLKFLNPLSKREDLIIIPSLVPHLPDRPFADIRPWPSGARACRHDPSVSDKVPQQAGQFLKIQKEIFPVSHFG